MDISGVASIPKCEKCKKQVVKTDEHRCEDCQYLLCRECDDKSTTLEWYEPFDDFDQPDVYLCQKCIKRRKKKEKKSLPM